MARFELVQIYTLFITTILINGNFSQVLPVFGQNRSHFFIGDVCFHAIIGEAFQGFDVYKPVGLIAINDFNGGRFLLFEGEEVLKIRKLGKYSHTQLCMLIVLELLYY